MRRHANRFAPVLLTVLALAAACRSSRVAPGVVVQEALPRSGTTAPAEWDAATRLLLDSAGARLATLELQRIAMYGAGTADTPSGRMVADQIAALERQLADVPRLEAARRLVARLVARRVIAALDAREAGLRVARAQLLVQFTGASTRVRDLDTEARHLAERRIELTALSEPVAGGR